VDPKEEVTFMAMLKLCLTAFAANIPKVSTSVSPPCYFLLLRDL
jgi:hypothetical protein